MAAFVFALCGLTSLACFALLLRQYWRVRSALLLRSSLAFLCFAGANILLFVDLIVLPQVDLRLLRNSINLLGVVVLLLALSRDQGSERP